jgi:hypothetical protein
VRPFLLENGYEDEVEFVEEGLVRFQRLLGVGALDDELDDEVADTCAGVSMVRLTAKPTATVAYPDTDRAEEPSTSS